ncbi:DNL zinc finger-domain-containing protein [Collybia nuda]|uniref:DNL zinc finger-domain-containing protein n=1 Tax=Collybia nuda TaxID=64659 RepID=A0A9P6CB97_9AGAR|nr:DNL zinc finger-domain-containing protein [Collybia nuda]
MLPSRLFRNTGLPPALRSLITPRASLPPTISVQLRLRLGVFNPEAAYSTAPPSSSTSASASSTPTTPQPSTPLPSPSSQSSSSPTVTGPQPLGEPIEPRLSMSFTCTVKDCGERSTHQFTKRAYERGIVLVQCPGCKNRHLIADHLGWFKESTEEGKLRTVEDILRARGETIRRGRLDADGTVEYAA